MLYELYNTTTEVVEAPDPENAPVVDVDRITTGSGIDRVEGTGAQDRRHRFAR